MQKIWNDSGHGPVVDDPIQKIDEYVSHRMQRESQIFDFIQQQEAVSSMDITNAVYAVGPSDDAKKISFSAK